MGEQGSEIWIVDDDASVRRVLARALEAEGFGAREFAAADDLLEALNSARRPGLVVTDLRMPGMDGLALLDAIGRAAPGLPVIVMTAFADLDNSVEVLRRGAFEILAKPFDLDEAVALVRQALATDAETGPAPAPGPMDASLIGAAPSMKQVFRVIARLAGSELNVLLLGETGTGKERIARALHDTSPRKHGPFVAVNVAAIPAELLESELFGHERGAFSGADQARPGYFEQAAGGTLLLDEIGEMPAGLQARLLRVLADGDFYRLGATRPRRADVRLIAATHRDLAEEVAAGRFRADLFHRLDVVALELPALRERAEDIPLLLDFYLHSAAVQLGVPCKRLSDRARAELTAYAWPGNVRELVNLCLRLTALLPGREIALGELPMVRQDAGSDCEWLDLLALWTRQRLAAGDTSLLPKAAELLEQRMIDEALRHTAGARAEAARLLGIGRNTLTRKKQD